VRTFSVVPAAARHFGHDQVTWGACRKARTPNGARWRLSVHRPSPARYGPATIFSGS